MSPASSRCPVCRAGFRDSERCSRCGADLRSLMGILARSWSARQRTRRALVAGDLAAARACGAEAQALHDTAGGRRLELLLAWIGESSRPPGAAVPDSSGEWHRSEPA